MRKKSVIFAAFLCALLLVSCGEKQPPVTDTTAVTDEIWNILPPDVDAPKLTGFYELNPPHDEGSHRDLFESSYIEADFRSVNHVDKSVSNTLEPYYIRIKELRDGSFIMLYNEIKNGEGVRMLTSDDGVHWSGYATVFEPTETKKYANPEAIVLQNGDILACAAWRITPDYLQNNSKGGIDIKRSTDNGKTWSEAYTVSTGLAWEPYFLQLRSGEVQLYWTNTTRYNLASGNNTSTGTALLRSLDNGVTWTGNPKIPYSAQVVAKQKTEYYDHVQFYTDQMPVAAELQNGTIVLSLESRLDRDGTCYISLAYSGDNWQKSLARDEEGPKDKQTNIWRGGGPYFAQLPSGETILKYSYSTVYHLALGNYEGREFKQPIKIDYLKNFSSFEPLSSGHTVLCSGGAPLDNGKNEESFDICTQKVNLCHALTAAKEEMTVDGNGFEWANVKEALFVGSQTQAQISVRFSRTANGLYILVDRLDTDVTSADSTTLKLSLPQNKLSCIEIKASANGECTATAVADGANETIGVTYVSTVLGTLDNGADADEGVITEIFISAEYLPDSVSVYPSLYNKDTASTGKTDYIDGMPANDNAKWIPVR